MLIYSFICSIVFTIVLVSFFIGLVIVSAKQKRYNEEAEKLINGFVTYDLTGSVGGVDEEKE